VAQVVTLTAKALADQVMVQVVVVVEEQKQVEDRAALAHKVLFI
jgi:hypothetical protein